MVPEAHRGLPAPKGVLVPRSLCAEFPASSRDKVRKDWIANGETLLYYLGLAPLRIVGCPSAIRSLKKGGAGRAKKE